MKIPLVLFCFFIANTANSENQNKDKYIITAISGLVIRSEAQENSINKGVIPFSTIISVLEFSKNVDTIKNISAKWAKVKFNGIEGWVFSYYIDSIEKYYIFENKRFPQDFKGGTFGGWDDYYSDKIKPDGTCEFYGGYSGVKYNGTWKNKETYLEINFIVRESIDQDIFYCQDVENASECVKNVTDRWESDYGKYEAEIEVKIIWRISDRGTIIATSTGVDFTPIKGKKAIRYHDECKNKDLGFLQK